MTGTYCVMITEARPVVVVTFVTEFDGHTSVAMDAELIMWLHNVVTSYVREKDTQKSKSVIVSFASLKYSIINSF